MSGNRAYICIDLKSFYASVECVERGLDPMKTNLAVADSERSNQTICLAITPAMKALGIKNRCRVFQIPSNVEYIMASPRMQLYIEYSANIYEIYLKYISKEDIHVYSIDEAFLDVTDYLHMYQMTAEELSERIMQDVFETTGITATCGIGSNLYLSKIALDIRAKHVPNHIASLNEETYRQTLWDYRPLTDFWRIGTGTAKRLERMGIYTMRGIAETDEKLLFRLFGIDAELLIDHAWGRETTTIEDIKCYKPKRNSMSTGQVLPRDYQYEEGRLIVKEMADLLSLDLVEKGLVTDAITLQIGYSRRYEKPYTRGSSSIETATSSTRIILNCVEALYERIADKSTPIRKVTLVFNNVIEEAYQQYNLFMNPLEMERERRLQRALLGVKKKYGKNAVLKGMNLQKEARTKERNQQIGGHKSGS